MEIKWSRKYDKCIKCDTTEIKHKGLGLCLNCYDAKRALKPKRKEQLKNQNTKWIDEHRKEYNEYQKEFKRQWYWKYREEYLLLEAGRRHKKQGKPVLQILTKYIPYMELVKTKQITYEQWKHNIELFDKVKAYIQLKICNTPRK